MRVTSNAFPDRLITQVQTLQELINKNQTSIATGQKIIDPSDNPVGFRRSTEIKATQGRIQEFRDITSKVKARADANFASATELQTLVSRASEIAVRASNIYSSSDQTALAAEANSLIERAVALGNRQNSNGEYLFGGTYLRPSDTDPATSAAYVPFSVTRNGSNQITAVTYRGNQKVVQQEVQAGSNMDFNIIGSSTTGTPRGLLVNSSVNVFTELINLRDNLTSGNINAAQSEVSKLRTVQDNIAIHIGTIGANLARLQITEQSNTQRLQSEEQNLSQIADADLAETILSLQQKQTALQGALQVGAQILNTSLLNYLR